MGTGTDLPRKRLPMLTISDDLALFHQIIKVSAAQDRGFTIPNSGFWLWIKMNIQVTFSIEYFV